MHSLSFLGPPGEPALLYAVKGTITSRSIKLKWTVPPDHGSRIRYYVIQGSTALNPAWVTVATGTSPYIQCHIHVI